MRFDPERLKHFATFKVGDRIRISGNHPHMCSTGAVVDTQLDPNDSMAISLTIRNDVGQTFRAYEHKRIHHAD